MLEKYQQYRDALAVLHGKMLQTAADAEDSAETAKALGLEERPLPPQEAERAKKAFVDFALYEYSPGRRTVIDRYRERVHERSEVERILLEAAQQSRTSLFAVVGVDKEAKTLVLRDLLNGRREETITDVAMSQRAVPGLLLFCRLLKCDGMTITSGSVIPFHPKNAEHLVHRYRLIAETGHSKLLARYRFILFHKLANEIPFE